MMTFFIVWIAGSVLSYPRMVASFYEINEDYPRSKPQNCVPQMVFAAVFSWVLFLGGIIIYFKDNEKYFWKWSKRDLRKKYFETYGTDQKEK
jgi:4-hydroxybenzoate polyprenyltransferase